MGSGPFGRDTVQIDRKKELRADLMLLIITLCWGVSYYLMDVSLTQLSTFTLNAYRFLGAFAVAVIFSLPRMRHMTKETLLAGLGIGAVLSFVYIGATVGVQNTTLSNSAFLCCTTVFFTPILDFLIFRKRASRKIVLAVVLSLIGIALMTLKDDFSFNMAHLKGDLFSLSCGVTYSLDIIFTSRAVQNNKVDPYQMGVMSLGSCGLIMLVLACMTEMPIAHPTNGAVWFAVIFLSLFCTGMAFILQPIAQQYTEASHVGIIFSLEPVFAGVTAFFLAGEVLTARGYIGEVLMIAALLFMEIDFGALLSGRTKASESVNSMSAEELGGGAPAEKDNERR